MTSVTRKTWNEPITNESGVVTGYEEHVNDIPLDASGNIALSEDSAAVKEIVDAIIKTHKGELQLATNRGISYETTVFAHKKYLSIWESEVREAVEDCDGVVAIESFDYDIVNDELQYTIVIQTEYSGTETISNV